MSVINNLLLGSTLQIRVSKNSSLWDLLLPANQLAFLPCARHSHNYEDVGGICNVQTCQRWACHNWVLHALMRRNDSSNLLELMMS